MIVRELFTKMGMDVDSAGFVEAILTADAVKSALGKIKETLVDVAKGFVAAVTDTAKSASEFDDLAKKTGISRTALQELKYASEQAGTSFDATVTGLRFLAKNSVEAGVAGSEMAQAFTKLGVSAKDANGKLKAPEVLMGDMADALNKLGSENERTNLVMKVFGKSGQDLLPLLKEGKTGIAKLTQEANDLGVVMSDELIKAGDDYGDNLVRLDALWKGFQQSLAGPILGILNDIIDETISWAKANKDLIKSRINEAMQHLADAIKAVWGFAKKAMHVFQWFSDHLKEIKTGFFLLAGALFGLAIPSLIATAAAAWAAVTGFFALGAAGMAAGVMAAIGVALPILGWILLGILILAALEDLYQFFTGGDSAIGRFLSGPWKNFVNNLKYIWGELKLMASDAWESVVKFATDAVDRVIAYFKALPGKIADYIPGGKTALDYWFPGGGASPQANAGQSSAANGPITSSNKVNATFNITAPVGADGVQVATEVEKRMDKFWETKMAENFVALEGG